MLINCQIAKDESEILREKDINHDVNIVNCVNGTQGKNEILYSLVMIISVGPKI
jgi:hypothetical protein